MNHLKVILWGKEIGRLVWVQSTRCTYFIYNPELKSSTDIPNIAPLLSSGRSRNIHLPVYGDNRPLYQGLPPFIADSLPDSWGNTLFDKWVKENKIPRNKITPLYKLMFIGKRGMGALEYEPFAADLNHTCGIDVKSLYEMSLKVLEERHNLIMTNDDELTLQALLAVGTSAGGRQMKAVLAINDATGEIRSGQTDGLEGFEYYILKFGDNSMPLAEIETAYYRMATAAGIDMEECKLLHVADTRHFLTKRFDRKNGKKIHVQTLAAINPEARSYEDLIDTCRALSLSESEIEQIFRRMVFNILANNTDDHNKNFSFLLEENNRWGLAPAYDMTFIFNTNGTGPNIERRMSIGGKTSEFTLSDLLDFAKETEIRNPNAIINNVVEALKKFPKFASECGIAQPWRGIIQKRLTDTLTNFGFIDYQDNTTTSFNDNYGRVISDFAVSVNTKGHYELSVKINGKRQRRFIRPNMEIYSYLKERDVFSLSTDEKIRLVESMIAVEQEGFGEEV